MHYEYKVVPAPRKVKRQKGVSAAVDLFAGTLTDAINEQARHGWEYVRAEHLQAETPRGWFRRAVEAEQTVLVFRREREAFEPRLAAVGAEAEAAAAAPRVVEVPRQADRPKGSFFRREPDAAFEPQPVAPVAVPRQEPPLGEPAEGPGNPLRSIPRLGPAERT